MWGAVFVAIAAATGNLLQGWDNANIAGAVLYIKREFKLETQPTIEGLIVAMSLISATVNSTFSGPVSDWLGTRPMLIISSVLYFLSGLVMLWAPNVYVLLMARLLDGFGIGLAVTLVPVYISETAPPEIRGLLNTLPQFTGSGGMFLSYCMVFGMSLKDAPTWRLMLGVLSIPSLVYFGLTLFYLPESPRWLVKEEWRRLKKFCRDYADGRMFQMAVLFEGLGVGGEASLEEHIIGPANEGGEGQEMTSDKDQIRLYGPEDGRASMLEGRASMIAKSVTGQANLGLVSRQGSLLNPNMPYVDPLVTLFGSVYEKLLPENTGSMRSLLNLPNMGSVLNVAPPERQDKTENWDLEGNGNAADFEDNSSSFFGMRHNSSLMLGTSGEAVSSMDIGGGWALAYNTLRRLEKMIKRQKSSMLSVVGCPEMAQDGEYFQASALVSQPSLISNRNQLSQHLGQGKIETHETVVEGSVWKDLLEPGVKRALFVGVAIQILQQVLIHTFESLLLTTLPVLTGTLLVLIFGQLVHLGSVVNATISTISVVVYFCTLVMGFGPIPNILCSEIFPIWVRGLCIAICALTFWIGDIIVTYTLPIMLTSIGLAGVFAIYAVVCTISWVFVFLKVPETKGMPLEVISEFFYVGSKQAGIDEKLT
ncbi:monosaccharide-sensing protein 2-like [Pyrus ussuriensis x Pyrus communis]|uniref:Monosaccharide-sensing protein 2-like n=1 Tax=Pyrus ussuriensis x Pyrus communis TaxID=2448454 RepID=A0A5N5I2S8_9ROSA|nr:monosaccharide-sensing protein 2-like [Pyrus ussuriensis x Pyrus communis]